MLIILYFCATGYAHRGSPEQTLSLEQAINIALSDNPEILASKEKINASEGRQWSGISLPAPELSVNYEYVPKGSSLNRADEKTTSIAQSFEFPVNYFLKWSKSSDEVNISRHEFKLTELSVILKVKSAYYTVLAKQMELNLAKQNLSIADDFLKKAEIRYNTGEASYLEHITAKMQNTDAVNSYKVKQNELESAKADLFFTISKGYSPAINDTLVLTDTLAFSGEYFEKDKLFESVESSPLLKIYELKLSSASTDRTLAWTGLIPAFNVSYFKQTLAGNPGFYGASFGISLPLWFMFEHRGKIQEAAAGISIAEAELRNIKNQLYLKLNKAFSDYKLALEQVHLYKNEILPQSDEVYKAAAASYQAGEITYLEFLQARQSIINSRNNFINALLSYNRSIISLEEAAGLRLK